MNVDFGTAIKLFFANYANFKGRSTRAEFWWVALFLFLCSFVLGFFNIATLATIFQLGVLVPTLAITFRRFHDSGKSGSLAVGLWVIQIVGAAIMFGPLGVDFFNLMGNVNSDVAFAIVMKNLGKILLGALIYFGAWIAMVVIAALPSGPDNQYGPNPYGNEASTPLQ